MELSTIVSKCPNEDAFLNLADTLLRLNLYGKYHEYLTILGNIANIKFDANQQIQQMTFNNLDDEIRINIKLTKNRIYEKLELFVYSIYEREIAMKYAMINLDC